MAFLSHFAAMITMENDVDLSSFNTFGLACRAKFFCRLNKVEETATWLKKRCPPEEKILILGGGSNLLLPSFFDGLVVKNEIAGITLLQEASHYVRVKVNSGTGWDDWVAYAVSRDWGGLENLSSIPGTVGAAPIQNISAYGAEVQHAIESIEGVDLYSGETRVFLTEECAFGYRDSLFKNALKGRFFILSITFRLTKSNHHQFQTHYGNMEELILKKGETLSLQSIRETVRAIRASKIPDPKLLGNAGSFFKNPSVSTEHYQELKKHEKNLPGYPSENGAAIKIPAGWLIEQCGWKGKRIGPVGVSPSQALILVHYGGGQREHIMVLAEQIKQSVQKRFGIALEQEVIQV